MSPRDGRACRSVVTISCVRCNQHGAGVRYPPIDLSNGLSQPDGAGCSDQAFVAARRGDLGKSGVALWTPAQLRYAKFQTRGYSDTREARLYSAASLALLLFLGFPAAFFSTGARNFPV